MTNLTLGLMYLLLLPGTAALSPAQDRSDFTFTSTAVTFPADKKVELKLRGTTRYRQVEGKATVEYKDGHARLVLTAKELDPPRQHQYTTYVFWAVTPEGLHENLGELRPRKQGFIIRRTWGGTIETATRFRTFCIVMTAEPHFLVEAPSREVILASVPPVEDEILGSEPVQVFFRGDIGLESVPWREDRVSTQRDRETPVDLFEARRALDIGRYYNIEEYAAKEFRHAADLLNQAEMAFDRGDDEETSVLARRAIIGVERARRLARERRESEQQRLRESAIADLEDRTQQSQLELTRARLEIENLRQKLEMTDKELNDSRTVTAQVEKRLDEAKKTNLQLEERIGLFEESERQMKERIAELSEPLIQEQAKNQACEAELANLRQTMIPLSEHRAKLALARVFETREEEDELVLIIPNHQLFVTSPRPPSGLPQLSPGGVRALDYLIAVIGSLPADELIVEGHMSGRDARNLSQSNSAAIVAYFLSKGLSSEKMKSVGRGDEAPLVKGTSAEARDQNQRIEITFRRR